MTLTTKRCALIDLQSHEVQAAQPGYTVQLDIL